MKLVSWRMLFGNRFSERFFFFLLLIDLSVFFFLLLFDLSLNCLSFIDWFFLS